MKPFLFLVTVSAIAASCGSPASDNASAKPGSDSFNLSKARQAIEATNRKFIDASLKGDSAGIVALYHSNAQVFPPNMAISNRKMSGSLLASVPKMGVKTFSLNTSDVTGNADELVETGSYDMGNGSKSIDKGKYIVVWKQENGEWKLWRDIWNSDNPPPAAKH